MSIVADPRPGPSLRRAFAHFTLGFVPLPIVAAALHHAAGRVSARHPDLLDRLAPLAGRAVIIDVDEFPQPLVLTVEGSPSRLRIFPVSLGRTGTPAATIGGSLAAFVELAEGRADGDALFFQRRIRFEGDTEAVLLVRNALDASEIDLIDDVLPPLGALDPLIRGLVKVGAQFLAGIVATESPAGGRSALP